MLFKQIILSNISLFISSRAIHIHIPYCYKSNAPNDPHKDHVVSMEGKWKRLDLNLYDKQSEYIYAEFQWSLKGTIMGARDQDHKHLDSFFPQSNDSLKDSGWDAVLRWGYLKSFFPQKRRMSRHDFIDLRWDLGRILNRLTTSPNGWSDQRILQGFHLDEGKKKVSDMGKSKSLPSEEDSCVEGQ
jgi:hypothetical protein